MDSDYHAYEDPTPLDNSAISSPTPTSPTTLGDTTTWVENTQFHENFEEDTTVEIAAENLYENNHFCGSNRWNLTFTVFILAGISMVIWCFIPGPYFDAVSDWPSYYIETGNPCYDSGFGKWLALGLTLLVVIIYWIESFTCSTSFKYLRGIKDEEGLQVHIQKIKSTPPNIYFKVECYHYNTYTTYSNGKATTHRNKVVSYQEVQPFRYRAWDDVSGDLIGVGAVYRVTKVRFQKTYVFADLYSQQCWMAASKDIQDRNRHRDTHMDFYHGYTINGYRGRKLSLTDPDHPPGCLSLAWYSVLSVFVMGYCFRSWFHSVSTKQRFVYKKRIQC